MNATTGKPAGLRIADYPVRIPMQVRWSDVDMYGHVNNAVYYQWFDSAINGWLLDEVGAVPREADVIGVVGESACSYESEVGYGEEISIGLAVGAIGTSSVTYVLAAFAGSEARRAALGHWVHVYVERDGSVAPIPSEIAVALKSAQVDIAPLTFRKLSR
ncbi:acyl-CoA thioesterase [Nocardioides sp. NBC_00850]|uniref:acyl-CoA thioesterase n=1 Tax=Nocardioides sp. NBC_00850 TaxID=2976001 RepID=UPI00386F5770|nr:acyl-CoA thioesterase [Nocardioides sp. NBC_00850]